MARASWLSLVVVCSLVSGALHAQERSIHWRTIAVEAHLDRDGVLRVKETQDIVYTGDWNGGERRFTVGSGQRFDFERLVRVDSATGDDVAMVSGDLDRVDGFDMAGSRTVRWRSRLPNDPPFDDTERTYRLEYSYGNILVPDGDTYRLDHDFAFGDRDGAIEAFTLTLTLDPAWGAPPDFTGSFGPVLLEPGYGFVVNLALRYLPAGRPDSVVFGAGEVERQALAAALLVGVLLLGARFYRREAAVGRFAADVPRDVITHEWLRQHVLAHRPEVIGAAWDEETGAAEVTAVLARLEAEGKLKSRVESRKVLLFSQHVLHMELLAERDAFQGYERALIDALFSGSSRKTDTTSIRKRYEKTGFTPSTKIERPVASLVNRLVPNDVPPPRAAKAVSATLLAAGLALCIAAGVTRPGDIAVLGAAALVTGGMYLVTLLAAKLWQSAVDRPLLKALWFLVPMLALVAFYLYLLLQASPQVGVLALAGLAALVLAAASSVFAMAMWRHGPERLRLRRELAAARRYFMDELRTAQPRLSDEWFPYLIAFGLGTHMDHWFKAFGGSAGTAGMAGGHSSWASRGSAGGAQPGGSESWSGLGGGGGFAGGGSSGAWVAAAGSVAAGVSAPSSSGSGGGGSSGGGSSSGGGGRGMVGQRRISRMLASALLLVAPLVVPLVAPHAASLGAQDTAASGGAERDIRRLRASSNAAIARHDTAGIAAILAPHVIVVTSNSTQAVGRDINVRRFAEQFRDRPDVTYERLPLQVTVFAQWRMASEQGRWSGSWTDTDGRVSIGGLYFAKWRQVDGRWLVESETYVPDRCTGGRYCVTVP